MSNEIDQTFSLDASQALTTLTELAKGYDTFADSLDRAAASMRGFNGAAGDAGIQKYSQALNQMGNTGTQAYQQLATSGQQSANAQMNAFNRLISVHGQYSTSLALGARIVYTQTVVKAFREVEQAISGAATRATEFQSRIQEALTIGADKIGSADSVSAEVRKISDAFNLPLSDVTAGLYHTLSFGIGKGAESLDFMGHAAEFAAGSFTSFEDSVKVGAGIMNALGLSVDRSAEVFSKLQNAISLGAVRGPELAANLSKVDPVARELGISLDEVLAAFTSLTVRGIPAAQAATEIRASMTALIKPSKDMEEALNKLGFSTASTAVQTLGYGKLLQQLAATTDGTAESQAKLFPNVRALLGALVIGGQGAEKYAEQLDKIRQTSGSLASERASAILATDAQRVAAEANKLQNALTTGFGQELLHVGAAITDFTGGIDNIGIALKQFEPLIFTGAGALGAYGVAAKTGALANAEFAASFGGVLSGLGLVAGAIAGGNFLGNQLTNALEQAQREFDAQQKANIEHFQKAENDKLNAAREADNLHIQAARENVQNLNAEYTKDVSNFKQANSLLIADAKRTAEEIARARGAYAAELGKQSEQARQTAEHSLTRTGNLEQRKSDSLFNQQISDRPIDEQVSARLSRAIAESNDAASKLVEAARSGDKFGLDRARDLASHADQEVQIAQSLAGQTKDRELQNSAAARMRQILDTQISAEKELQTVQGERQKKLEAEHTRQDKLNNSIKDQLSIITKTSSLFDKSGKEKTDAQQSDDAKKRAAAFEQLNKLAFSQKDLDIGKSLGLASFITAHQHDLQQKPLQLKFDVESGLAQIKAGLAKSFSDFKISLKFDEPKLENLLGKKLNSPDQIAQGLGELEKKAESLRKGFSQVGVDNANIKRLQTDIIGLVKVTEDADGKLQQIRLPFVGQLGTDQQKLLAQVRQQIEGLAKSPSITDKSLQDTLNKLGQLGNSNVKGGFTLNGGLAAEITELSRAVGFLKELQQLQQSQKTNPALAPGAVDELKQIQTFINGIDPAAKFEAIGPAISNGVGPAQSIAAAMQSAADSAERAAAAAARIGQGGGEQTEAFGGLIRGYSDGGYVEPDYYAAGGLNRGRDTVPARLSPGESVVNADSTAKFYSQIQAINAGHSPHSNRADSASNITTGDIHIHGVRDAANVPREMMNQFARQQRRGAGRSLR